MIGRANDTGIDIFIVKQFPVIARCSYFDIFFGKLGGPLVQYTFIYIAK